MTDIEPPDVDSNPEDRVAPPTFLKLVQVFAQRRLVASRRVTRAVLTTTGKFAVAAAEPIGFRELLLFGGVALLAVGMWTIYPAASFLIPGAILVYVSIFGTA